MDLALFNLQRLIRYNNHPTNQLSNDIFLDLALLSEDETGQQDCHLIYLFIPFLAF